MYYRNYIYYKYILCSCSNNIFVTSNETKMMCNFIPELTNDNCSSELKCTDSKVNTTSKLPGTSTMTDSPSDEYK